MLNNDFGFITCVSFLRIFNLAGANEGGQEASGGNAGSGNHFCHPRSGLSERLRQI